jgi:uncharacterized membrane protein YwaF
MMRLSADPNLRSYSMGALAKAQGAFNCLFRENVRGANYLRAAESPSEFHCFFENYTWLFIGSVKFDMQHLHLMYLSVSLNALNAQWKNLTLY